MFLNQKSLCLETKRTVFHNSITDDIQDALAKNKFPYLFEMSHVR